MTESLSARRLVENEVFFRQRNERVVEGFAELRGVAEEENDTDWLPETDPAVHFYCECADEKCRERIILTPSKYAELHQNKSQFTVLPGHNVPEVERIVQSTNEYVVVEKYQTPPKKVTKTNRSGLNKS
jgi:hypothetical protein